MINVANVLRRNGIACVILKGRGFNFSMSKSYERMCISDVMNVIEILKGDPRFSKEDIGIIGHSYGAAIGEYASLKEIGVHTHVLLGMISNVSGDAELNVLMGFGAFDEVRTYNAMLASLKEITGVQEAVDGRLYGSFSDNTARKLLVSQFSDHMTEPYDDALLTGAVSWFKSSFGLDVNSISTNNSMLMLILRLLVLFILLLLLLFLFMNVIRLRDNLRWILPSLSLLLGFIILWLYPYSVLARESLLTIYLLIFISYRISANGFMKALKRSSVVIVTALFCLLAGILLNSLQYIFAFPDKLILSVAGILLHVIAIPAVIFENISVIMAGAFGHYTFLFSPLLILFILEIIFPGFVPRFKRSENTFLLLKKRQRNILILLTVVFLAIITIRGFQGFLEPETMRTLGLIIFRVFLIPVLLFAVIKLK